MRALIFAAIATVLAGGGFAAGHETAGSCPVTGAGPARSCVIVPASSRPETGQQITAGKGANPGTPWLVTDHTGGPMAWVNLYGLYSGGDGGKMPGGLICVTNGVAAVVACLTPEGTLQLGRPGRHTVTLTPRDIRFLHKLERGR